MPARGRAQRRSREAPPRVPMIHLVYSTKHRKPWLPNEVRENLFAYQSGIFKQWESPAIVVGGVEDHVHALFALSKNHALKKIVEEVKKGSSKWMKTSAGTSNRDFAGRPDMQPFR